MSNIKYKEIENNNPTIESLPDGTVVTRTIIPIINLFYTEDSNFGLYICEDAFDSEDKGFFSYQFKITGIFTNPLVLNRTYEIKGIVKTYKGEKEIKISSIISKRPIGLNGIKNYLKTLKGINTSKANLIFEKYKEKSIESILNNPDDVSNLKGVSLKLILSCKNQIEENESSQYAMSFMLDIGISIDNAKKLYNTYKNGIVNRIKENPYCLMNKLKNFGFQKCDKICRYLGLNPKSDIRIKTGILYVLQKTSEEDGNCYLPLKDLIERCKNLLNIQLTEEEMETLVNTNDKDFLFYWNKDNITNDKGELVDYKKLTICYKKYKKSLYYKDKNKYRYKVYNFSDKQINKCILSLSLSEEIIIDKCEENEDEEINLNDRIYLERLYREEIYVAKKIIDINEYKKQIFTKEEVEKVLNEILKQSGYVLEEKQREACIVYNMFQGGFNLLIGNAGTGKTFILNIILKVRDLLYKKTNPLIFAPTGKASKVVTKDTKRECKTIHRGLGIRKDGFLFNEDNPLDTDMLVIDESSMLDLNITYSLLKAIKLGTQVVFIGDIKQLMSVGCGNILIDIIKSNTVFIEELNVCKRQGVYSGINLFANKVIEEKMIPNEVDTKDAYFINRDIPNKCLGTIITSINKILEKKNCSLDDIQVLAPQKKSKLGIYALNYIIQSAFNSGNNDIVVPWTKFIINEKTFTLNFKKQDKVINTKNNYSIILYKKEKGVLKVIDEDNSVITNGECGRIEDIYRNKETKELEILVKYDDFYCIYNKENINDLKLAWALTIHKSEGSEWENIILCISSLYYTKMLDNSLLYTGITRAKDFLVVVGDKLGISTCLKTHNIYHRYTYLQERLKKYKKQYV